MSIGGTMSEYLTFDRNTWLHILRNPWGWEQETVDGARRWAGEEIHRLEIENNCLRDRLSEIERQEIHLIPDQTMDGEFCWIMCKHPPANTDYIRVALIDELHKEKGSSPWAYLLEKS